MFLYDKNELYEEKYIDIHFYELYSLDLISVFNNVDIEIISITVEENLHGIDKIYTEGNNIKDILYNAHNEYTKKVIENGYEMVNIEEKGFKISSMKVRGLLKEIIKLENKTQII